MKNINVILKVSIKYGTGWETIWQTPVRIMTGRFMEWVCGASGADGLYPSFGCYFSAIGRQASLCCAGCFLTLILGNSAQAGVYRCKDAAGKIAYSQMPCPAEQQSDQLRGINSTVRQDKDICRRARELGMHAFTQMRSGSEPGEIIDEFGGLNYINPPTLGVINFAASLRYNTEVTPQRVGSMSFARCLEGGFGKLSAGDLPTFDAKGVKSPTLTDPEHLAEPNRSPQR